MRIVRIVKKNTKIRRLNVTARPQMGDNAVVYKLEDLICLFKLQIHSKHIQKQSPSVANILMHSYTHKNLMNNTNNKVGRGKLILNFGEQFRRRPCCWPPSGKYI